MTSETEKMTEKLLGPKQICHLSRKEELKNVAYHFADYLVRSKLIRERQPSSLDVVKRMYIDYQAAFPSHVKSYQILEALREARLLKKKKSNISGHGDCNLIEFKDQIFHNENLAIGQEDEVRKPRLYVIPDQNRLFRNKLSKDPEIQDLKCLLCKLDFDNLTLLDEHCSSSRTHLLRRTYRDHRKTFLRKIIDLEIECNPDDFIFQIHYENTAEIKFKNVGKEPLTFTFQKIEPLIEMPFITMEHEAPKTIKSGEVFVLKLTARFTEYDGKKYPIVVELLVNESRSISDLLLEPKYIVLNDDLRDLTAKGEYEPNMKNFNPVVDYPIISGTPLPRTYDDTYVSKGLLKYEIPNNLRRVLKHRFRKFASMTDSDERKLLELRAMFCNKEKTDVLPNAVALNAQNYFYRFRHLLWIEEHQMKLDIMTYNMKDVGLIKDKQHPFLLGLKIPGLLEGRPSVIKGDSVYIHRNHENFKYQGVVHVVEQSVVYVSPHKDFRKKYIGEKVNIEFTFSRYCLQMSHRALDQVQKRNVASIMFPTKYGYRRKDKMVTLRPFFNPDIGKNPQQSEAVKNIVNNTAYPAPYIIYGPPGTGKTATLVEAITQVWSVYPNSKLCVCAPSNSAADVIAERLLAKVPCSNILRFYCINRNWLSIPEALKKCSNVDTRTKDFYLPDEDELKTKRIIIVTPITAGRLENAGLKGGYFHYLFIDEAGHAVETELLIPIIGLLTNEQDTGFLGGLVLAGDPKQLGPVIRSFLAVKLGLGTSLLERLMEQMPIYHKDPKTLTYNANVIVKLLNNYRSHPVILHVPNKEFYDGQLKAKGSSDVINCAGHWEELPKNNFPLIFHGVKGAEDRDSNSPSYFNLLEVQKVGDYVSQLVNSKLSGLKVTQEDIGVIAPYRKQVERIRLHLRKKNLNKVTVASVEEFQGQEKLIIIISTVRSRSEFIATDFQFGLGFLRNEKRFNVALTRAKALLIVIGDPDVLQCDKHWRTLMNYCKENNSFRGFQVCDPVPDNFDVNERIQMDLSDLIKTADEMPEEEKPSFKRED